MPTSITTVLLIALAVVLLGDGVVVAERLTRYFNAPKVRALDRSELKLPPPAPTMPLVEELMQLGFTRLGEAGLPGEEARRGPVQVWYFIDREATTVGGVFAIAGTLGHAMMYTWFGEEAVIVTAQQRGEQIDEPNFRFHTVMGNLAETYRHHLVQLPDFSMRFGRPRRLDNMADVLYLDAIYNQRFGQRRLRGTLIEAVGRPLVLLYTIGVLLGAYGVSQWLRPDPALLAVAAVGLAGAGLAAYQLIWQRAR